MYGDGATLMPFRGGRPGDVGFDIMHFNLHKTFSTPHGGGGPGQVRLAFQRTIGVFTRTNVTIVEDGDEDTPPFMVSIGQKNPSVA